jgi:hypothetical protein
MGISFISNDTIQAALVAYLKLRTTLTNKLVACGSSASEIREDEWQGTNFVYPNVRVRMIDNSPMADSGCGQNISFSVMVFSEHASSLEAEEISGIIAKDFHGRSFSSNSIAFSTTVTNLVPAIRSDIRTWRSEVLMTGIVSG